MDYRQTVKKKDKDKFDLVGIEIPYPSTNVYIKAGIYIKKINNIRRIKIRRYKQYNFINNSVFIIKLLAQYIDELIIDYYI